MASPWPRLSRAGTSSPPERCATKLRFSGRAETDAIDARVATATESQSLFIITVPPFLLRVASGRASTAHYIRLRSELVQVKFSLLQRRRPARYLMPSFPLDPFPTRGPRLSRSG